MDIPGNKNQVMQAAAIVGILAGIAGGVLGSVYVVPWYQVNILHEAPGTENGRKIILDEESAVIETVAKVNPAVVSIIISRDLPKLEQFGSPFGGFFFSVPSRELERQQVGAGSGFIITEDGMIVTNKHVVSDTEAEYTVITKDGQKYPAKVLTTDPFNDIAIVKIEARNLPVVSLGDSDHLKLGSSVIAIGNALGEFQNSVTTGVVSGIGRNITATGGAQTETLSQVIQTDAAINPGNSGGPLLNLSSEVIGVNSAVSLEGQLIGFAIPINQVKKVINDVKEFGRVRRPFLGVRYTITERGALIVRGETVRDFAVVPGSPADKAGLSAGDVISELDNKKITFENTLADTLRSYSPGDMVTLKILRDGKERVVAVILGEAQ